MVRWFVLLGAWLALTLLLRLGCPTTVLPADEVDALAAGGVFAAAMVAEEPEARGLTKAFAPVGQHPRIKHMRGGAAQRRALVQAPLPRWVAGAAITGLGGGEVRDLSAARWGGAAALALALALLGLVARSVAGWPASVTAVGLMLCLPGVVDAGTGVGAQASGALAAALLLVGVRRVVVGGAGGVVAGVAFGLCLLYHPGGFFLMIPALAAVAIGRSSPADPVSEAPGELSLPPVRVSVLALPIIGAVVLVAAWPALWNDTGRGLAAWLTEHWRTSMPAQSVVGLTFDQGAARAPQAWTALVQWVAWTPWPILVAWGAGVFVTARRGAQGWWTPVLMVATVLLVGGADGGLWGARASLSPLLWVPTAATAMVGTLALAAWLRPHLGWGRAASRLAAGGAVAALTVLMLLTPTAPLATGLGAEVRQPFPLALIEEIAEVTPAARVAVVGGGPDAGWLRAFQVVWMSAGLKLHYRPPAKAQWLVVVADPSVPAVGKVANAIPSRAPELSRVAGGLRFDAYKVR